MQVGLFELRQEVRGGETAAAEAVELVANGAEDAVAGLVDGVGLHLELAGDGGGAFALERDAAEDGLRVRRTAASWRRVSDVVGVRGGAALRVPRGMAGGILAAPRDIEPLRSVCQAAAEVGFLW